MMTWLAAAAARGVGLLLRVGQRSASPGAYRVCVSVCVRVPLSLGGRNERGVRRGTTDTELKFVRELLDKAAAFCGHPSRDALTLLHPSPPQTTQQTNPFSFPPLPLRLLLTLSLSNGTPREPLLWTTDESPIHRSRSSLSVVFPALLDGRADWAEGLSGSVDRSLCLEIIQAPKKVSAADASRGRRRRAASPWAHRGKGAAEGRRNR